MKKTFFMTALLGLLAPLSMAETLSPEDAIITLDSTTTSGNFETAQTGGVYTIAVLDLTEFKKLATSSTSDAMLISYEGLASDGATSHYFGIGRGTYSGSIPLRYYDDISINGTPNGLGWYIARGSSPNEPYTLASLDFTDVVAASLAMAVKNGSNTASCLTLMLADGSFVDYAYESTYQGGIRVYTGVAVSPTYVDSAYVYTGDYSADSLKAASHDILTAVIPEPTTATLTLLALAGLAARRRRK